MPDSSPWATLRQAWCHVGLPGYREFLGTYQSFPASELPPIPISLDEDCDWLIRYGSEQAGALDRYERDIRPSTVIELAAQAGVELPRGFLRFMVDPELQKRVRSCTDCYLDPGGHIVKTVGSIPGDLIHFLSDSQFCFHWYLHVSSNGTAAVLGSEDLYCYRVDDPELDFYPTCSLDQVDLQKQVFICCAPSFSEFLYRFWIENEIRFSLASEKTRRPLTSLELAYVNHYAAKQT
jgi:hypothetical protein